jgi:hypothetical protein
VRKDGRQEQSCAAVGWSAARPTERISPELLAGAIQAPHYVHPQDEQWQGEVVHLSWKPRVFLYKNFLNDAECEHIKQKVGRTPWLCVVACPVGASRSILPAGHTPNCVTHPTTTTSFPNPPPAPKTPKAADQLTKSTVVDNDTGEEKASDVRTSSGTFFEKGADEVGGLVAGGGWWLVAGGWWWEAVWRIIVHLQGGALHTNKLTKPTQPNKNKPPQVISKIERRVAQVTMLPVGEWPALLKINPALADHSQPLPTKSNYPALPPSPPQRTRRASRC